MWKFSDSRDYKVHKAYEVLLEDANQAAPATIRPHSIPNAVWKLIWKVKIPLKACNLVWKLLHNSPPTFLT